MSRRTETAYKAESPGKSAQHDKALDSGDTVNAPPTGVAPGMATCRGTGQESAEATVGARKQARKKEKSRERLTPPKGQTQRREEPL
jgi:hypothetical protein